MAEDETADDDTPKLPPDARLRSLDERLDRLQQEEAKKQAKAQAYASTRVGQLILGHLVGGPAGGFIVGLVLDKVLGTKPWLTLLMMFLGFGVGVRNALLISKTPPGQPPGAKK
jgi:ATP synthase protein I